MSEARSINEIIADALMKWGNEKVEKAKGILLQNNRVTQSRNLYSSLQVLALDIQANNIGLKIGFVTGSNGINPADYYKFVDKGVKGIGGGKTQKISTGEYSFKNGFVSKKFAKSIQSWIASKPIQVRKSKSQSKESVIKQAEQLSWAIAKNIKKTGIGKTMFWSDTFNDEAYADLASLIEKELGGEFRVSIQL